MSFIRGVVRGVVRPVVRAVTAPGVAGGVPANALKIDGVPVTIDSDYITISSE